MDLIFGSNSELRGIAEYYAADDMKDEFCMAFLKAWVKVMNNDRFDVSLEPENIVTGITYNQTARL